MNRLSIPVLFAALLLTSGTVAARQQGQGQQVGQQPAGERQAQPRQQQQAAQRQPGRPPQGRQTGSEARQSGARVQAPEMRRYVVALEQMGRVEPRINEALEQGEPVPARVLNLVPRADAEQAMRQAGLSQEDFRRITNRLRTDESTRRAYEQVARQQVGQPGVLPAVSPQ